MTKASGTTSRDKAIMDIRTMILTGELKPNQRVTEKTVADRLAISRTPVREAFRELVQMGLLTSEAYKSVRVAEINLTSVREIYELRAKLEPFAAELAASRIDQQGLQRLEELNDQLGRPGQPVERIAKINDQFHLAIAEATQNSTLVATIADLRSRVSGFRIAFHYHPMLVEESVSEHIKIISALSTGSAEAAKAAMSSHVKIDITSRIV